MRITGLSGNEIYCLRYLGLNPGDLSIGNGVYSMGLLGGVIAGFRGLVGGEVHEVTNMISQGRHIAITRLEHEISKHGGVGATGVSSEIIFHPGNIEFLSIGSTVMSDTTGGFFTTSSDGQELFCQMDAGYLPIRFAFGNVAYSIGVGRSIVGGLKTLVRGEVKEFTEIFWQTRHHALTRLTDEAKAVGANSVVGIRTTILAIQSLAVQEMLMIGTASKAPMLEELQRGGELRLPPVVTSDMTAEEMWNLAACGYVPMKLLVGTSVYSLGLVGNISAFAQNFVQGEIPELTSLVYEAREHSLSKVRTEARRIGADDVVGIKTYIYSLGGGLIEFLAIGTAVKYVGDAAKPRSPQLPVQAVMRDKDTFINNADSGLGFDLNAGTK